MPYDRIFTQVDPVVELRKHNMVPSITRGKATKRLKSGTNGFVLTGIEKDRPIKSRSKTTDIVAASTVSYNPTTTRWSREGSSLSEHNSSLKKVNFPSKLSAQLNGKPPVISQSKANSCVGFPSRELEAKSNGRRISEMLSDGTPISGRRRKSETPEKLLVRVNSRSRSLSVPPESKETYSISTIVKARSLAMKWRGKQTRRQGRRHTILPTITDDSTKFSLCAKVKCSPQFEEVIKLLEGDEDTMDAAVSGFKLLHLK